MRRRAFIAGALLLAVPFAASAATKRSSSEHARMEAIGRAFAKAARDKSLKARYRLHYSAAMRASAKKLRHKLSAKQRAALARLSDALLAAARRAQADKQSAFAIDPQPLRPQVALIGRRDASALSAAVLLGVADELEHGIAALARELETHLDGKKAFRAAIARLRALIREGRFPAVFRYRDPFAKTVQLRRRSDALRLLERMEGKLERMVGMTKQFQRQLQATLDEQLQLMQILANVTKHARETFAAIIANMR